MSLNVAIKAEFTMPQSTVDYEIPIWWWRFDILLSKSHVLCLNSQCNSEAMQDYCLM